MRGFPRTRHIAPWVIVKDIIIEVVANGPKYVDGLMIVSYAILPLACDVFLFWSRLSSLL